MTSDYAHRPGRFSHLTSIMIAFGFAGLIILTLSVLQALLAFGPLVCEMPQSQQTAPMQPFQAPQAGPMNCDLGITQQERDDVTKHAFTGIAVAIGGFVIGVLDKLAHLGLDLHRLRRGRKMGRQT